MKISIVAVGKLKEKYLKQGIQEYVKRLTPYANVEIIEVPDEKAPETLSEAEMEEVKQKEGERILAKLSPDTYVITLEIEGKSISSEQLANKLDELSTYGPEQNRLHHRRLPGLKQSSDSAERLFLILFKNDLSPSAYAADFTGAGVPGYED